MKIITSPNTVLANSLNNALDIIQPRVKINKPKEIIFCVGTQINGIPHIGTYIVQCASFVLARKSKEKFGIETRVEFGALDNAPYEIIKSSSGHKYQITYFHALKPQELNNLIDKYYTPFFGKLQEINNVRFTSCNYQQSQATEKFRSHFIRSLHFAEKIKWCVAPSSGKLRIRIPCPKCFYAEKYAERTNLVELTENSAKFECMCLSHGRYTAEIKADASDNFYLDLNTLYRNLIKESICTEEKDKLYIMMKGGDWVFSTQPVDWALGVMGYNSSELPMRLFTPQVVTNTGAKLSKSLIRDGDESMDEVPEWIIDMGKFAEENLEYVDYMIWLVEQFLSHPRHMYRSYTYQEIIRIMKNCKTK